MKPLFDIQSWQHMLILISAALALKVVTSSLGELNTFKKAQTFNAFWINNLSLILLVLLLTLKQYFAHEGQLAFFSYNILHRADLTSAQLISLIEIGNIFGVSYLLVWLLKLFEAALRFRLRFISGKYFIHALLQHINLRVRIISCVFTLSFFLFFDGFNVPDIP